jgi:glycosyltransferase involved in cell wall biosynthesis
MITVCFIDTLGLAYDGSTLNKRGLGGSESATIYMARELAALGFSVKVFCDCVSDDNNPGIYDGVEYCFLDDIEKETGFDIYIGVRAVAAFAPEQDRHRFKSFTGALPNFEHVHANSKYRVLYMHDTFCDGDDLIEDYCVNGRIDKLFTLSDWHSTYIMNNRHSEKMRNFEVLKPYVWQTRNGIQIHRDWVDVAAKDPDLFVYNSSLTKGMVNLVEQVWPQVKARIPQAKLIVIGGFYRFRSDHGPDDQELRWREYAAEYEGKLDMHFTGVIRQDEIADWLSKASYMIYPAAFPETFGISALESLAYNTPLLTCRFGALEETAVDQACYKMDYAIEPNGLFPLIDNPSQVQKFVDMVVNAYENKYLHQQKMYACNVVKQGCTWADVALQWKQHFYQVFDQYLTVEEYRKVNQIHHHVNKIFNRLYHTPEMLVAPKLSAEVKFNIIIPVYNSEKYIPKCIASVLAQDYENYHVYIINDASTDLTGKISDVIQEHNPDRITVIHNTENQGAVHNQITTIKKYCDPESVIMLLDGDDWLANDPAIFNKYNAIYQSGAQYTYGSCWSLADNIPLIAQPYPPEVLANKTYRDYKFNWNMPYPHLRTFVTNLVTDLPDSVFQDNQGNWYGPGGDNATFYNIIEQADPEHVVCIPDVVYVYNDTNPLNDYKVNGEKQNNTANEINSTMNLPDPKETLKQEFEYAKSITQSDIYFHLDKLYEYASKCDTIAEFGVRDGWSTRAFLHSGKKLRSYDLYVIDPILELFKVGKSAGIDCDFSIADSKKIDIDPVDLLFIDTNHEYEQLTDELAKHHTKAKKYIILHDTYMFGLGNRQHDKKGILTATIEFMIQHPEWVFDYHTTENNGLTVLKRVTRSSTPVFENKTEDRFVEINNLQKFTITVPTMWKCQDLFYRALVDYCTHELVDEVIIINNNIRETPDWDILSHEKIRMNNMTKNIYVNKAWNMGVDQARNKFISIVNDDIKFDLTVLYRLQDKLSANSGPFGIIAGEAKFGQPASTDYSIDFVHWKPGDIIHNFGQAMFVHKDTWTPIPEEMEMYWGDDFILHSNMYHKRKVTMIYNIKWESPLAATTGLMTEEERLSFHDREQLVYSAWADQHPIDYSFLETEEPTTTKNKKILIGIPTAKNIESDTFKSLYDLYVPDGYETELQFFYGYTIDQVRNLIAEWAKEYDYLLSVDSDIVLPKDALIKMLNHDVDMVSGVYMQRLHDKQVLEIYKLNDQGGMTNVSAEEISPPGLHQVSGCGFGAVLIKSDVIRNMEYPHFEYKSALSHAHTFSEDVYFCKKALETGAQIYVDSTIICEHIGARKFIPDLNA